MNKRRSRGGLNVGITTITVMLIVICMTIFAVLSFTTARQEKKLASKYASSVTNYYSADTQCALMAEEFSKIWNETGDKGELLVLAAEYGIDAQEIDGTVYISYSWGIDEKNALLVKLGFQKTGVEIEQWQQAYVGDWEPDYSINVLQ